MNAESSVQEIRIRAFDREFGKITQRESWLSLYLNLRDGGDTHSEASETVRAERQVASIISR